MKKIAEFVCKNKILIIIVTLLLLIPSVIGLKATKVNYDMLNYLPKDIETMKGQKILTDDFKMGAFSISIIDNLDAKNVLKLENKIRKVKGVEKVASLYDLAGTTIPIEMLPSEVTDRLAKKDSSLLVITFKDGTSDESTLKAVRQIKSITKKECEIGGMSAMALDTMDLSNKEIVSYVIIAVILCLIVLSLSLDSYLVPFILLISIGIAILFNMGTNVFLGNISYITKAISAVLQLGVTTDFSIFLYHSYERAKKNSKSNDEAMQKAIVATASAVAGSSLTTIAGFLALCAMTLTLGRDIGIVMAKGVMFGVICVITIFPALILAFDKAITKTSHKEIIPTFKPIKDFTVKHYKAIFTVAIVLLIPAFIGQMKVGVYYNLDRTLPSTLDSSIANDDLKTKYNIVSPEIILVDKSMTTDDINAMVDDIKKVKGIDFAISYASIDEIGIPDDMIDSKISSTFESKNYKAILVNSKYKIATDDLNNQITKVNKIVKKYDKKAIVAGEGPLMKDLSEISTKDFNNVTYASVIIVLLIMFFVLKSYSLPFLLTGVIEFAIFVNMCIPYYTNTKIPFIASIVIGTIQLGATIDYAILMTTKYLKERETGKDKFKSVRIALDKSVSSIFVSGMCFFAATFGVGMYSKLEMVGSLCRLISRGAVVSMLTVIMILPSVLLIFDKLICKTTKGLKKGDLKMSKINSKKAIKAAAILFASAMLVMPFNASALSKDETVYAKLNNKGDVKKITVTEHLINDNNETKLTDTTTLKNIKNLNGKEKFTLNNEQIVWETKVNKDIYYQGASTASLPVSVKVTYFLNGKEMNPSKMAGKKGNVDVVVKYTNNDFHTINGEGLYTPFVIGLTTTLSTKTNSNITVTNGKVVSTGTTNVIAAISAPGLYEDLDIDALKDLDTVKISFATTDFETNSIYSAITPKVLDNSDFTKLNNLDQVFADINKLSDATTQVVQGAKQIADGSYKAYVGAKQIKDSVDKAIENLKTTNAIDDATAQKIEDEVIAKVNEEINGEIDTLTDPKFIASIKGEAMQLLKNFYDSDSIPLDSNTKTSLQNAMKNNYYFDFNVDNQSSINQYNTDISQPINGKTLNDNDIKYCAVVLATNFASNNWTTGTTNTGNTSLGGNISNNDTCWTDSEVRRITIARIIIALENKSNKYIDDTVQKYIPTIKDYIISTLDSVAEEVALETANVVASEATNKTITSLTTLSNGLGQLVDGLSQLKDGSNTLYQGTDKLNADGISKIANLINGEVKTKLNTVKNLQKLSNKYTSFASDNDNVNTSTTKFIIMIDGVSK